MSKESEASAAALAEHLTECYDADFALVMQQGQFEDSDIPDGWELESVEYVMGKRVRYYRVKETNNGEDNHH